MSKKRRHAREPYRWLGIGAVTLGLGVAMTTGHGIALAEPTSDGGTSASPSNDAPATKKAKKPNTAASRAGSDTDGSSASSEHAAPAAPASTRKKRGARSTERVNEALTPSSAAASVDDADSPGPAAKPTKRTVVTPKAAADSQSASKPAAFAVTVAVVDEKPSSSSNPVTAPPQLASKTIASAKLRSATSTQLVTDSPAPATPAPAPLESLILFVRRAAAAITGHGAVSTLSSAPPDPVPMSTDGSLQYRLDGQRALQISPSAGALSLAIVDGAGATATTPVTIGGSVVGSVVFDSKKTRAYVTTNDIAFDRTQFGVLNLSTGAWIADPIRINGTTTGPVFTDKNTRAWLATDDVAGGTSGVPLRHRALVTLINTTTGTVIGTPIDKPDTQLVGGLNFYANGRALVTLVNDQTARGAASTTYLGVINTSTGALISPLVSTGGSELAAPITFDSKKTRAYITTNDIAFDRTQFGVLNLTTGAWTTDPLHINGTTTGPIFTDKNTRAWLATDDVAGGTPGMGGLRHRALVTLINVTTCTVIGTPIDKPDVAVVGGLNFYAKGRALVTLVSNQGASGLASTTSLGVINTSTGALIGPLVSTGGSELTAPITFDSKKTRAYVTTNDVAFDRAQFGVLNLSTGAWITDPIRINGTTTGPVFTDKNTRAWLTTDDVAGGTPGMGGLRHRTIVTLINVTTGAVIGTPIDKADTQLVGGLNFYANSRALVTLVNDQTARGSVSTTYTGVINTSTGALLGPLASTDGSELAGPIVFDNKKTRAYVTTNDTAADRTRFGVLNLATGQWVGDPVRLNGTTTGPVFTDKTSRVWLITDDVAGGTPGMGGLRHRALVTLINVTTGTVIGTPIDKPDVEVVGGLNFYAKGRALVTLVSNQGAGGMASTTSLGVINTSTGALISPLVSTGGSELAAPITFDSKKTRAYVTTNDMAADRTQFGVLNLATGQWVGEPIRINGTTTGPVFTDKNTRAWLTTDDVAGGTSGVPLRHRTLVTLINTATGAVIATPIDKADTQLAGSLNFYTNGRALVTLVNDQTARGSASTTYVGVINSNTGALLGPLASTDGSELAGPIVFDSKKTRAYITTNDMAADRTRFGVLNLATGQWVGEPIRINGTTTGPIFTDKNTRAWLATDDVAGGTPGMGGLRHRALVTLIDTTTGTVVATPIDKADARILTAPNFYAKGKVMFTLTVAFSDHSTTTILTTVNTSTGAVI